MTAQQELVLRPHPGESVDPTWALAVRLGRADGRLRAEFVLAGDFAGLRLPPPAPPESRDGLWRHTCFELFVGAVDAPGYCEFNLAPSGQWAGYAFSATRRPALPSSAPGAPHCNWRRDDHALVATTVIDLEPLGLATIPLRVGVSAVLEACDGRLSHWALEHPRDVPDFHDPGAFVVRLT